MTTDILYTQAEVDTLLAAKATAASVTAVSASVTALSTQLSAKADASLLAAYVPNTTTVAGHPLSSNVTLVKADVGLGSVDNTADVNKAVLSATKLATARTINGASFDGTGNITIPNSGFPAFACAVVWDGTGSQPVRPATASTQPVFYICPSQPATGGTTAGGGNAVAALDVWLRTP